VLPLKSYTHIFGPVASRRLGRSLGVDLTPAMTCTLDCLFCQLGHTAAKGDKRGEYVPTDEVIAELNDWLDTDGRADCITVAGSGEPTLHTGLGRIIDAVKAKSQLPVVLLTNGTTLHDPAVRMAASKADIVKASLSCWDQSSFEQVNRPCDGMQFSQVIEGQRAFRAEFSGELWTEVFVVPGINSEPAQIARIAEAVTSIGPDRVQLNTAVRPPADGDVVAASSDAMMALALLFTPKAEVIAAHKGGAETACNVDAENVLAVIRRHPSTAAQMAAAFGAPESAVAAALDQLVAAGKIEAEPSGSDTFYRAR
jgi:wyosine [tRNA(Phe)-imidazoG37] synthetase (radical SAM superfamily)